MARKLKKGATSQSIQFVVLDSTSTTGGRKTGLAYNTASLTAYYTRNGGSPTAITLATLAAANSAWSSGGFKELDATNKPGWYRLDLPDAAVASGADSVGLCIRGATGMVQVDIEIQLEAIDAQDAVRAGLTALPNANAEASGGLPTLSAAQASNGTINANVHRWLTGTPNALQSGRVDSYLGAVAAGVLAAASFAANALDAVWSTATRVLTAATNLTTDLATPTNITAGTITTVTNLTNAPTAGDLTATMKTSIGTAVAASAVASVTGAVGSVTGNVGGNVAGSVGSVVGAVGSVTGNLGGNVTGSVGSVATGGITSASFAAGAIDATAIAADAIGSSELAASAVAEIQSGLSTLDAAAVATATQTGLTAQGYTSTRAGYLDTLNGLVSAIWSAVARTLTAGTNIVLAKGTGVTGFTDLDAAGVRTAVGLATANLDTQLDALPTNAELATALGTADDAVLAAIAALNNLSSAGAQAAAEAALAAYGAALQSTLLTGVGYIDTEVAAIKAKTDNLTFTSGTDLDVNVQKVNDVALTGVGTSGDPWGPV